VNVLVTGARGFVGRALCDALHRRGDTVRTADRDDPGALDVVTEERWSAALSDIEVVVHLAGRAHVLQNTRSDSAAEFRRVNVDATLRLAMAAAKRQVRRFVFVSSIGVLGSESGSRPFSEESQPAPVELYAVSKYEAELQLREVERDLGMEVVIVRPPLVYGPYVKGNFLRLLRLVRSGLPLPFAGVRNARSFIGVRNLSDLLICCAEQSLNGHRVFVAADGHDVSTPELLRLLAKTMQMPARLFPFPLRALAPLASLVGRRKEVASLVGSLQVNASLARSVLGWRPCEPLELGMRRMVEWFLAGR
jgi:nucleoside-diphosphate-sugar epimerase